MDIQRKNEQIERVVELRSRGASYGQIAKELGISPATARKAAKLNEYGKRIFDGKHNNPLRDVVFDSLSEIAGRELRQRLYTEYITPASQIRNVETAVDLAIMAISAAISFGHALYLSKEKMIAREQKTVNELLSKAQQDWQVNPEGVVSHRRIFGEVHCGSLLCQPSQAWVLDPRKPKPNFELTLVFCNGKRRVDISVQPGGRKDPGFANKTIEKLVRPYGVRRLYYPKDAVENRKWVRDAVALVLIYLAQERLVDFDADDQTRNYIVDYLAEDYADVISKGTISGKVNAMQLLSALILNLLTPGDYHSFRKYVRKTAYGLKIEKQRQPFFALDPDFQTSGSGVYDDEPLATKELRRAKALRELDENDSEGISISQAAQTVGISERRVYELIRNGRVKKHKLSADKSYKIPGKEVQNLVDAVKQKRLRQTLIARLANREGIQRSSAWRWIRRQEKAGLSLMQILKRLQEK